MSPPTISPADWCPIETAPIGATTIVWGAAGHRFARLDQFGQWRNMMGRPMDAPPTHWMPLPPAPVVAGTPCLNQPRRSSADMAVSAARLALARIANGDPQAMRLAKAALADLDALVPMPAGDDRS